MTDVLLPARRFDVVDIAAVATPAALEAWTFDAILDARFSTFLTYWAQAVAADPTLPMYDVTKLRGNPVGFTQRVDAFREGLLRQRVNEAVLATFLLFAVGADLDARAAEYNTFRAPGESDASLRLRALLAWENLSIGGSYGGYEYQARSVAPSEILDCAVFGHEAPGVPKGEVRIVVLGAGGRGVASPTLLAKVDQRFNGPDRRSVVKVNDKVVVVAANVPSYAIDATLVIPRGADPQVVLDAQRASAAQYAAYRHRIGGFVDAPGILDAIGSDNPRVVQSVKLRAPFTGPVDLSNPPKIGGGPYDAPYCSSISLDWEFA